MSGASHKDGDVVGGVGSEGAQQAVARHAGRQGEIPAAVDLAAWAAALTMLVQGLQVVVKADPDPRRLLRSVDAVLSVLASPEGLHPHADE